MPFSICFSSKGVESSVAISTAVERSSIEISPFFFSRCLSMNAVELTKRRLRGLKKPMRKRSGRAMKRATAMGRLPAKILGVISPTININEVTITTSRMKALAG